MRWGCCDRDRRQTILQQGGDYLLAVKGNQPKVVRGGSTGPRPAGGHPLCAETMTLEKAHESIDGREYHVMAAGGMAIVSSWKQLRQHWRGHLLSR